MRLRGSRANTSHMANPALLEALAHKIQIAINESGRCMLTLPAEVAVLNDELGDENALHDWANRHSWTVVRHIGRDMIEFFRISPEQPN